MQVTQVYQILNAITQEILGESALVNEDLSNVVELGTQFQNVGGLDNYVRSLNDHIGRMVFVDRVYGGRAPSVMMDGWWEFGSILEKVRADMPEATENESWELSDGESYDPNIFYKPSVAVSFWNKRVTFEIPISITERQVKSSFSSPSQLNAFYSMLQTAIQNSMTVKLDALIMRTINAGIGETMHAAFPDGTYAGVTSPRAVNLLYKYNQEMAPSPALTVAKALSTPEFIRYCALQLALYSDRMEVISTLFNAGQTEKFTPKARQKIVMLSEFRRAADVYLQADTFHDEFTRLPSSDSVTYWQGSGTGYSFSDVSSINLTTPSGDAVTASGILGVIFDRDALGVANLDRRVTTHYNPKAEFWNEWHKMDAGYFLDLNENFVVFYIA